MQESKRYQTILSLIKKEITQKTAGKILNLSTRQIRNIQKNVLQNGIAGVIHKNKGRASNNNPISDSVKKHIVHLAKTKYIGFKPTLLSEYLAENENILYSRETIRKLLIESNIYRPKRIKEIHRTQRERRESRGELIQVDGSYHDWFSNGEKCWLINFIDDATGEIFMLYTPAESTIELMKTIKSYIKKFGCPLALYVDKDSIYKTNRTQYYEEQLMDKQPVTQFTRAMNELGIDVIYANSPQAKGRVERSFRTHQDRLVKENKLKGIRNIEQGNIYLKEYINKHNKKFAVKPKSEKNMHRKVPHYTILDKTLCIKEKRKISKDYTVQHNKRIYQIEKEQNIIVLTRNSVMIETRLDESIHIKYKDTYLKYTDITNNIRPKQYYPDKEEKEIIEEETREEKEEKIMTRKEISNVKTISPWRKTNGIFFKNRKF